MRKRFHHQRVCTCSPTRGVCYLEARLLRDIVNSSLHPIRCASTCGQKALRGLTVGDLCAEARHPLWALKVWKFTISEIHSKDYDDWLYVCFNEKYVRFHEVIADGICEILGRRIDDLNRRYGWEEPKGRDCWEYYAGDGFYDGMRYEKYDCDWDSLRDKYVALRTEAMERQQTERIFSEGQVDLPPQAQDFFDYWQDYERLQQELDFQIDDWD